MAETTSGGQRHEVAVRRARAGDRDEVLAFCATTWPNGDYIEYVWDEWLADEEGALLVAAVDERPVAIVHVRMMSRDEAWLEGMRVNPAERRRGIGGTLTSRALVAARERGATVARLFVDSDNTVSQQLVSRFGLQRVAEVVRYTAPALMPEDERAAGTPGSDEALAGAQISVPDASAFERIWLWLTQSNLTPFSGGLEYDEWSARALTEPRLREYLERHEVLLLEEWETILALAVSREIPADGDEPPRLDIRYADGQADGLGRLALVLRKLAAQRGLARVDLWLPDLLILRDALDGAGYTHGATMLVYARTL